MMNKNMVISSCLGILVMGITYLIFNFLNLLDFHAVIYICVMSGIVSAILIGLSRKAIVDRRYDLFKSSIVDVIVDEEVILEGMAKRKADNKTSLGTLMLTSEGLIYVYLDNSGIQRKLNFQFENGIEVTVFGFLGYVARGIKVTMDKKYAESFIVDFPRGWKEVIEEHAS